MRKKNRHLVKMKKETGKNKKTSNINLRNLKPDCFGSTFL